MNARRSLTAGITALFLTTATTLLVTHNSTPHDQTHAVLWMQRAAEYKATCLQTYNTARSQLERAIADETWTACLEQVGQANIEKLPPAVIADVDETVLDNSGFNARMVVDNTTFTPASWEAWCKEEQAGPIPGSLAFFTAAQARGVRVIYITNRKAGVEETATRNNLKRLGYPLVEAEGEDLVLCKGEIGDKTARRRHVCQRFRVIGLFGDNFGDFSVPVKPRKAAAVGKDHDPVEEAKTTGAMRHAAVAEFADYWGTKWFMIPNPAYGSWESVLFPQAPTKAGLLQTLRKPMAPGDGK